MCTAREDNTLPGVETTAPPHPPPSSYLQLLSKHAPAEGIFPPSFLRVAAGPPSTPVPYYRLHRRHSSNCVLPESLPRLCRPRRIPALLFMPSVFLSQQPTPGKDPQGRGDVWIYTTNCATKRLTVGAERDRVLPLLCLRSRRVQLRARYEL